MLKNYLLLSTALLALSSATAVMAKKPEGDAPPGPRKTGNKQVDQDSLRGQERSSQRHEQREYPKKNKREEFQEKHQRYGEGYEYHKRERSAPTDRYQDFQEKRERYKNRQEQSRLENPVGDVKSVIDERHRRTIEVDNTQLGN